MSTRTGDDLVRRTVTLPWPVPELFPNRKAHWTVVYRRRRAAKEAAWALCVEAGVRKLQGPFAIRLTFRPPNRRLRDVDNVIAACKGHIDGIAWALGVDDSRIAMRFPEALSEPVDGGAVTVEIVGAAE